MYNYIGIRGHRGSGKSSISVLLALALDYLIKNDGQFSSDESDFDYDYQRVCKKIIDKEITVDNYDSENCHLESFGDSPITAVSLIFGISPDDCYDDNKKDEIFVNLRTFETTTTKPEQDIYTAKEYFLKRYQEIDSEPNSRKMKMDVYLSLRELISYYGSYVMKYFFGSNIWIKSLRKNQIELQEFFTKEQNMYKIYTDVKFTAEVDYILENNGVIISLNRKNHEKKNFETSTNLIYDSRINYTINFEDIQDETTRNQVKSIALDIYENTKNKNIRI